MKAYPRNFWLMCLSLFFFMVSFNLILPELNQFITDLGGADKKGLIISLFAITAMLSRPISGKLSDTIGRKKVMIIGILVGFLVTLSYPLFATVTIFLVLRFIHGLSAGFLPTGATALVTDILLPSQRGTGMGLWGVFISLGIGVGQYLGSPIKNEFGMTTLFLASALSYLVAGGFIFQLKETLANPVKLRFSLLKLGLDDVFEPHVRPAAIVMFLSASASGTIFVLSQDICEYLHIPNKGWFFGIYVLSTIFVRLFSGKLSDIIGRPQTLLLGMSMVLFSIIVVAISQSVFMFGLGAVLFGIATGISSPTLFSWTADLSPEHRRGIGAGTLFIALEFGIIVGSASTTFTYKNNFETIFNAFLPSISLVALSLIYLVYYILKVDQRTS